MKKTFSQAFDDDQNLQDSSSHVHHGFNEFKLQRQATVKATEINKKSSQLSEGKELQNKKNEINAKESLKKKNIKTKFQDFIDQEKSLYEHADGIQASNGEEQVERTMTQVEMEQSEFKKWKINREKLVDSTISNLESNSIKLSRSEQIAEKKLHKLKKEMLEEDPVICTGPFQDKLEKLKNSPIYDCLDMMPKTAVHHLHLTATSQVDFLIKLTYNDFVYYSKKTNLFKVSRKGIDEEGYISCNELRRYYKKAAEFDAILKEKILLNGDMGIKESHGIWQKFQPKFSLTFEMYNYYYFFEQLLYRVSKDLIKQFSTVIEYKHIFGCVFDDDHKPLSLKDEIAIFKRVQDQIQTSFPLFQLRIVVCGLKMVGLDQCKQMVEDTIVGEEYTKMIAGYDLVCEEDFCPHTSEFVPMIIDAQVRTGNKFPLYMHSGESSDRYNDQLYDSILLGTKRIGHGFHLLQSPTLMKMVKENDICIECCPVSNLVLGYVRDLRIHPARSLFHQNIPISISSDDPGFYGYHGVTLDFVYVYVCWELGLADLKQLVINSIKHSSVRTEEEKHELYLFMEYKWSKFIDYIRGKY